jgi:hypothetical protein
LVVLFGGIPAVGQRGAAVEMFPRRNPPLSALDTIEVVVPNRRDEVHIRWIKPTLALGALKFVGHPRLLSVAKHVVEHRERLAEVFLVRFLELPLVVFTAEVSVGRSWNFPSIICDGFPTDFAQQFHCCLLLYDEIPLTKRARVKLAWHRPLLVSSGLILFYGCQSRIVASTSATAS